MMSLSSLKKFKLNFILILSLLLLLLLSISNQHVNCLHLTGLWSPSATFFKIITRFGFQRTDYLNQNETSGYIYGNVTLFNNNQNDDDNNYYGLILLTNRSIFKTIHNNYLKTKKLINQNNQENCTEELKEKFCENIFNLLNINKNDNDDGDRYYRYVPIQNRNNCDKQQICNTDNDDIESILNSQFTFIIDRLKDANFWYLLLLSCNRYNYNGNDTFNKINDNNNNITLSYNLWIVNGNPYIYNNNNNNNNYNLIQKLFSNINYQFSYEQQNLIFYLIFLLLFILLLLIQLYNLLINCNNYCCCNLKTTNSNNYYLNYLFTISLLFYCQSLLMINIDRIIFAINGRGLQLLSIISDIMKIISISLLISLVIIIAKGYLYKRLLILENFFIIRIGLIIIIYTIINILLYIWIKNLLNFYQDEEIIDDEYHTIPGWLLILIRLLFMFWFTYELRHTIITMNVDRNHKRLKFYLHFGAGILVWFIQQPLVILIAIHIDLMWRFKIINGFTITADFFTFAILLKILWTTIKFNNRRNNNKNRNHQHNHHHHQTNDDDELNDDCLTNADDCNDDNYDFNYDYYYYYHEPYQLESQHFENNHYGNNNHQQQQQQQLETQLENQQQHHQIDENQQQQQPNDDETIKISNLNYKKYTIDCDNNNIDNTQIANASSSSNI